MEKSINSAEILVVDDQPIMRQLMGDALVKAGYAVVEADSGESALDKFQSRRPDAILLDVYLPGMDGFNICRFIRQMPDGDDIPILMVTGCDDDEMIQRAYEAGATDFIAKPVNGTLLDYRMRYILRSTGMAAALRRSQKRLNLAQRIADLGYYEWKVPENAWFFSEESRQILGLEEAAGAGEAPVLATVHPEDRSAVEEALHQSLSGAMALNMEYRVLWPNGQVRYVHHKAELLRDNQGQPMQLSGIVHDVTERLQTEARQRENEERLTYLAYHDPLTGLPNRLLFEDRCQHAIAKARRSGRKLAILFLDLDQFKRINDSLGHEIGDKLLRQVAERLRSCVREEDTLARLGGDEFVLLLEEVSQVNAVRMVANKILAALSRTFDVSGFQLYSATSIGISVYPDNGETVADLMRCADIAMYGSKEGGRNSYQFYTQEMNAKEQEALLLENGLRQALAKNELELYYQPQIDMISGRIVGTEALLRWNHPERGLLLPTDFLPLAEETGLIFTISDWVLQTVCRQNRQWQDQGFSPLVLAVNITPRMFQQRELPLLVGRALAQSGLEPRFLELEITESMILNNVEASIQTLKELGRLGVSLSIDNFGTGYSSLSNLRELPIKNLKIDRVFINNLTSNPSDAAVAVSVIALARSMNLGVIAAGVETEEQLQRLKAEGCHHGQGYLFSRPLPAGEVANFLGRPPMRY